jgi:hypothetical protein
MSIASLLLADSLGMLNSCTEAPSSSNRDRRFRQVFGDFFADCLFVEEFFENPKSDPPEVVVRMVGIFWDWALLSSSDPSHPFQQLFRELSRRRRYTLQ